METTTIEITAEQKAALDDRKQADSESYKSVLQRLIDNHSPTEGVDRAEAERISREVVNDMVNPRALE